mgnify:CR=1 FL=1
MDEKNAVLSVERPGSGNMARIDKRGEKDGFSFSDGNVWPVGKRFWNRQSMAWRCR